MMFTSSPQIGELILRDHQPLLHLIETISSRQTSMQQKRLDYFEFESLLKQHSFAEERSLYAVLKDHENFQVAAFEGDFEHTLCAQLVRELVDIDDDTRWLAKVRVLLDIKNNHIRKEEDFILNQLNKTLTKQELGLMGKKYLKFLDEIVDDEKITVSTTTYNPSYHF